MFTVKHRMVFDPRTGDHSRVTDILTGESSSRAIGHVSLPLAKAMLIAARSTMNVAR